VQDRQITSLDLPEAEVLALNHKGDTPLSGYGDSGPGRWPLETFCTSKGTRRSVVPALVTRG